MLALPDEEKWPALMKEFDFMEKRIGDACSAKVAGISEKLDANTKVSEAANANSLEAVKSIQALAKGLSVTLAVEGFGKSTAEVVSTGVVKSSKLGKLLYPILAASAAAVTIWHNYTKGGP